MRKYFAGVTQFLSWPFTFLVFYIFFNLKINGRENLQKLKPPFIIISNHISFYDSFVFRLILDPFTTKLPLRFMGVRKFDRFYLNILAQLGIVDIVYALFGVFVVEPGKGMDKNLEEARRIIKSGGNVVIYPEGSIVNGGKIDEFKLGAAVLARETSAPVLPISLRLGKKKFFNTEFVINIGESIKINNNIPPIEITNDFLERILY